jgi:L-amino acid N-acyltransferase YncA
VYLKHDAVGMGIGMQLYTCLIEGLKAKGIHAVIGGIALPNERSQRLHEKLGFERVATFPEVGYKFDKWIDVGYWELKLNI